MKLDTKIFLLLFVPILTLVLTLQFNDSRGPYYLNVNSDPAYLYLINSMNVATGRSAAHVDNPGSTVQIIGGLTIKTSCIINGIEDVQKEVLLNPEIYLNLINKVILSICMIGLLLVGVVAYNALGIGLAIFMQVIPFTSWQIMKSFTKVSPEPFSVLTAMLMIIILLTIIKRNDIIAKTKYYAILFGIVCGFGLATKLTFLPWLLVPIVMLPGIKPRLIFGLTFLIFFHLFFLPGIAHYEYLIDWAKAIFIHSGHYGEGPSDILNPNSFFANLFKIAFLYHTFLASLFLGLLVLLLVYFKNRNGEVLNEPLKIRMLLAVTFSMLTHIIIVGKHYHPHYLVTSFTMMPFLIYLSASIYQREFKTRNTILNLRNIPSIAWLLLIFSLCSLILLRHNVHYLNAMELSDWLRLIVSNNLTLLIIIGATTITSMLFLAFNRQVSSKANPILLIVFFVTLAFYHLRHIDLVGFNNRMIIAKNEGMAIEGFIKNQQGKTVVLGDKSSSKLFALKYGTYFNYPQPHHFERLQELYKDVFFWGIEFSPRTFYTWESKTSLDEIFKENTQIIIQGDTSGLTPANIMHIENANNCKMEKLFGTSLESVYLIRQL